MDKIGLGRITVHMWARREGLFTTGLVDRILQTTQVLLSMIGGNVLVSHLALQDVSCDIDVLLFVARLLRISMQLLNSGRLCIDRPGFPAPRETLPLAAWFGGFNIGYRDGVSHSSHNPT